MNHLNKSIVWIYLICIFISFESCKKTSTDTNPQPVVFTFSAPDTILFEYSGNKPLAVGVQCTEDREFGASLSGLNGSFSDNNQDLVIRSNQQQSFNITFNQLGATPGIYPCELRMSVFNVNNYTPQYKTIQLVYAPNCGYNFINHINGEITYQINGNLLYRNISCSYNNLGQLVISNLTSFPVTLDVNCQAQTVTMKPVTINGFYMTGDGTIQGQFINLNIYSNGALDAVSKIKP
jgi:hypothetical protein